MSFKKVVVCDVCGKEYPPRQSTNPLQWFLLFNPDLTNPAHLCSITCLHHYPAPTRVTAPDKKGVTP